MKLVKALFIALALLLEPVECAKGQSSDKNPTVAPDSTLRSCGLITRTETYGDTTFSWYMVSKTSRADRPLRALDSTLVEPDSVYQLIFTRKYVLLEAIPVKSCPPVI